MKSAKYLRNCWVSCPFFLAQIFDLALFFILFFNLQMPFHVLPQDISQKIIWQPQAKGLGKLAGSQEFKVWEFMGKFRI